MKNKLIILFITLVLIIAIGLFNSTKKTSFKEGLVGDDTLLSDYDIATAQAGSSIMTQEEARARADRGARTIPEDIRIAQAQAAATAESEARARDQQQQALITYQLQTTMSESELREEDRQRNEELIRRSLAQEESRIISTNTSASEPTATVTITPTETPVTVSTPLPANTYTEVYYPRIISSSSTTYQDSIYVPDDGSTIQRSMFTPVSTTIRETCPVNGPACNRCKDWSSKTITFNDLNGPRKIKYWTANCNKGDNGLYTSNYCVNGKYGVLKGGPGGTKGKLTCVNQNYLNVDIDEKNLAACPLKGNICNICKGWTFGKYTDGSTTYIAYECKKPNGTYAYGSYINSNDCPSLRVRLSNKKGKTFQCINNNKFSHPSRYSNLLGMTQ
jgi:hypothetical protein